MNRTMEQNSAVARRLPVRIVGLASMVLLLGGAGLCLTSATARDFVTAITLMIAGMWIFAAHLLLVDALDPRDDRRIDPEPTRTGSEEDGTV